MTALSTASASTGGGSIEGSTAGAPSRGAATATAAITIADNGARAASVDLGGKAVVGTATAVDTAGINSSTIARTTLKSDVTETESASTAAASAGAGTVDVGGGGGEKGGSFVATGGNIATNNFRASTTSATADTDQDPMAPKGQALEGRGAQNVLLLNQPQQAEEDDDTDLENDR